MKNAVFIITSLLISLQTFAHQIPANDTCIPVPYVNFEVSDDGDNMLVTWEKPCDTCQVLQYVMALVDGFGYCIGETPDEGVLFPIGYTTGTEFSDPYWGIHPPGYYAYAIKAIYEYCESTWTFSNIIIPPMNYYQAEIIVENENGEAIEDAVVVINGANLCSAHYNYSGLTNSEGSIHFDSIRFGDYNITASKTDFYSTTVENFLFWQDTVYTLVLEEDNGSFCEQVQSVELEIPNPDTCQISWDTPCDTCQPMGYQVAWVTDFNHCNGESPDEGIKYFRSSATELEYTDILFGGIHGGYFAYGVNALYDSCQSAWTYSDVLFKEEFNKLTVIVTTEDGSSPSEAEISLNGYAPCENPVSYSGETDAVGVVEFEEVLSSSYDLTISKTGYHTIQLQDLSILSDETINILLILDNSCPAVPFVNAEVDGEMINVGWDIPIEEIDVTQYEVGRVINFNPCAGETPEDGILEHKTFTNSLSYSALLGYPRYSVYAIKAHYDSCTSPWIYSNLLFPEFEEYPFEVKVFEEGGPALEGVMVSLEGNNICTQTSYEGSSDENGSSFFEEVQEGIYSLTVSLPAYNQYYLDSILISYETSFSVYLTTGNFPAADQLTVDKHTGTAEWNYFGNQKKFVELQGFNIYLDDSLVAVKARDELTHQFQNLVHNTSYTASVSAKYETGESEWISTTLTTNFLDVNELSKTVGVKLFPNPAEDVVYIQAEQEILKAEIMNSMGQVLMVQNGESKKMQFETSKLQAGIYFVRIQFESGSLCHTFVIRK